MKFLQTRWLLVVFTCAIGVCSMSCSRLLPERKGVANSRQLVIDTRRAPAPALTGCFIPAVTPAVTIIPVIPVQKLPPNATITAAELAVVAKNGDELSLLETAIEDNQVYLRCSVPKVDAFSQVNVVVTIKYKYR